MLCKYLLKNTTEFPSHKSHLLQKSEEFFTSTQFDNVTTWKNKIMSCIENENLSIRQIVTNSKKDDAKNSHDVRRFCKVTKKAQKPKRSKKTKKNKKKQR